MTCAMGLASRMSAITASRGIGASCNSMMFNILKAPVVAAMGSLKEGDDWGEAVWKGFLALADPLVSEKPLAGAIIDVLRDKEVRGDGSRPTPLDSKVESFGGKLSYVVREALLPGATDQVIKTALGAYSTATGDSPTYKGREYQLGPELFSRLGFRSYTYDPLRLFARDAKSLKSAMNEDWGKRVGSYLYSADRISAGGMRERIATANENRRKVLQDVSRRINAMKVLGYKAPVIQATLTGADGLAVDDVRQAARGVYETHYPSKQMQVRMREAGNRLRDRQDRLAMLREAIAPLPEIRPLFDK